MDDLAPPRRPRELRAKQEELLERAARSDASGWEERLASAEARARQLAATLARKDAALRCARRARRFPLSAARRHQRAAVGREPAHACTQQYRQLSCASSTCAFTPVPPKGRA
jgi:hypothetical protein